MKTTTESFFRNEPPDTESGKCLTQDILLHTSAMGPVNPQLAFCSGRLATVQHWEERAEGARFQAKKLAKSCGVSLRHMERLTYDKSSGNMTIYLNGAQVAQQNIGSVTPQPSYDLYLGLRPNGSQTRFYGALDDISLYNRALTSIEVENIYAAGQSGKCCPSCNWL